MRKLFVIIFFNLLSQVYSQTELDKLISVSEEICKVDIENAFCNAFECYKSEVIDSCYIFSGKALLNEKNEERKDLLNYFQGYSAIKKKLFKQGLANFKVISDSSFFRNLKNYEIGYIYIETKQYQEAIKIYLALLNQKNSFNKIQMQGIYNNLGVSYLHINNLFKAKKNLNKALDFADIKDTLSIIDHKINLANIYYEQYIDDEAIPLFYEAYDLSKKVNDLEKKRITSYNIAIIEKNLKNYKKSLEFYEESMNLKDSINNRDRIWELAELDKTTAIKEKESLIIIEKEKLKRQKAITLFLITSILLILVISFLIYSYRRKKTLLKSEIQKLKIVEEERKRISEELHDGVLGKLFGVRFNLGLIDLNPKGLKKENYKDLLKELQEIEKEIRDVSHKLGASIPETSNFPLTLKKLLHSKSEQGGFDYTIKIGESTNWSKINLDAIINLYRIIQEILHNIVKHARAKNVELSIISNNDSLILGINDDGIGFDLGNQNGGIGLKNIYTRAKKINALVEIDSELTNGSTFKFKIPI